MELPGEVKPEITESMIEVNSAVNTRYDELLDGAGRVRDAIVATAERLNLAVAGGGSHPSTSGTSGASIPRSASSASRALRLPRQAVHGVRPAHPRRRGQRRRRGVPHRTASRATSRTSSRCRPRRPSSRARTRRSRPRACTRCPHSRSSGHMPAVAIVGGVQRLLRRDDGLRHRREHEGLLLGHPAQARVRHDRDPRLRHAAHGGARRAARRLRADARRRPAAQPRRTEPVEPMYRVYGYNRFQACRFGFDGDDRRSVHAASSAHPRRPDRDAGAHRARGARSSARTMRCCDRGRGGAPRRNDSRWLRERYVETKSLTDVVRHAGDALAGGAAAGVAWAPCALADSRVARVVRLRRGIGGGSARVRRHAPRRARGLLAHGARRARPRRVMLLPGGEGGIGVVKGEPPRSKQFPGAHARHVRRRRLQRRGGRQAERPGRPARSHSARARDHVEDLRVIAERLRAQLGKPGMAGGHEPRVGVRGRRGVGWIRALMARHRAHVERHLRTRARRRHAEPGAHGRARARCW